MVGYELKQRSSENATFRVEDSLEELAALADTAKLQVEGGTYQRLDRVHPGTLIGTGKIEELTEYKDELKIDVFLFDDELSPRQQRELEKRLDTKVVDRTALILDVFAKHARTREGQLQVELAQYEYRLPRLTRMWTHLARQAGGRAGGSSGGVGLRGPGETQLEVDRREIGHKIAQLRRDLEKVRAHRARHRKQRKLRGIPVVALVGYTNAGKSTLINTLTQADVLAADQLFATLDPTTRRVVLPHGNEVLVSDTVGFIQKLPTKLVAAFRATLEEIEEADLLLHVVDVTHANAFEQAAAVSETLKSLGITDKPMLNVLNKIDCLDDPEEAMTSLSDTASSVAISAKTGQGVTELLEQIEISLKFSWPQLQLHLPYSEGGLLAKLHEEAVVHHEEYQGDGVALDVSVPSRLVAAVQPYIAQNGANQA